MGEIRERLSAALARIEEFADGRFELRLRPPATEEQVRAAETEFGMPLPEDLRELYLLHDGQDQVFSTARLFLEEPFATLDRALACWRDLRDFYKVSHEAPPAPTGFPASAPELRAVEHDIAWFPFAVFQDEDKQAYWADMNPIDGRPVGQIIEEGPWAHPPQFVADSVLDMLEAIAAGIQRGDMTTTPQYGFITWGFGPQQSPMTRITRLDPRNGAYPSFLDDLPPEWSGYLRTKSPLYAQLLRAAVQGVPAADAKDIPLSEPGLARADMVARPPRSVAALGDLDGVRTVVLRHAETLDGLDAVPLNSLVLIDSPDVSFRGIQIAPHILELVGDVPIPDEDQQGVRFLKTPLATGNWRLLSSFPALTQASLWLEADADPNDHDWVGSEEITHLDLRGGTISSLEFISRLPKLAGLWLREPVSLAVSHLKPAGKLFLNVAGAPVPDDISELARLEPPHALGGPIEWFRALEGRMSAGVWTGVYDGGDASKWADLTGLNWAERASIMKERGLPGY